MRSNPEIKANLPRPEGFLQKLQCVVITITNNNQTSSPAQKVPIYGNKLPDNFERKIIYENMNESCNMESISKAIQDGVFTFNQLRLFAKNITQKGTVELEYFEYGIQPSEDEKKFPSHSHLVEYTPEGKSTKFNVYTDPYQMQTDIIALKFDQSMTLNPNSDLFAIIPPGETWGICFVYLDDLTKDNVEEAN